MEKRTCACCGGEIPAKDTEAVTLSDGAPLCGTCVRRLRVCYPVTQEVRRGKLVRNDSLAALTTDEVREADEKRAERLEELRVQHGYHNAVFRVVKCSVEKQGLFKAPKVMLTGFVLYGKFDLGERVKLLHGGSGQELVLEDVAPNLLGGRDGEAGYETTLSASGKGVVAAAGDWIVKD